MRPYFSMYNPAHRSNTHSVFFGNLSNCKMSRFVFFNNANNFVLGNLCACLSWAPPAIMSVLGHHIANIFQMGSNKQMARIATWPIVAFVKNAHAFWNWAICKFPRDPMGSDKLTPIHYPVSSPPNGSYPWPATIWIALVNSAPKSIWKSALEIFYSGFYRCLVSFWSYCVFESFHGSQCINEHDKVNTSRLKPIGGV